MEEIGLLAEVIEQVSDGKHSVYQDRDGVTILDDHGGSMLEGETTLDVWHAYKEMCDVKKHKLQLTW